MRTPRLLLALPLLLAGAACEQVDSVDVRTHGIYADLSVTDYGDDDVEVKASLRVGGSNSNTYLDLVAGDRLEARARGETKRMDRDSDLFGAIRYRARFERDDDDRTFNVAFLRGRSDTSAPDSVAELPAPFTAGITFERGGDTLSREDDDLYLRWTPASTGSIHIDLSGSCIHSWDADVRDDGSLRIDAGELEHLDLDPDDDDVDTTCAVTVTLTRERQGEVDDAYGEGGRFSARQVRTVRFTSKP